jgi:SAM-dependent methyltransferase
MEQSQRSRGLYSWLTIPAIYEWFQASAAGGKGRRFARLFADQYVAARQGSRILDIGCGTGAFLDYLPESSGCHYCGFDANPRYIQAANAKYGHRARFWCQRVSESSLDQIGSMDIVIARCVLHHLADGEARGLIRLAHQALDAGGYLVTVDPVFTPQQSRLARLVVSWDRGKFVRSPEAYRDLATKDFNQVDGDVHDNTLRIPYTHFIMKCWKR